MVVGSERSDVGRQRTLRDLLSIGGIVGCVALGVAVLVAPAASNLRSIVPDGSNITAPEVTARIGDVAVEVRPGASAQRRAASSITALSPAELVLAPIEIAGDTAVLTTQSFEAPSLLASAADVALVDVVTALPPVAVSTPIVEAPVATSDELSAQSSSASRPGKAKGGAKGLASAPSSSKRKTTTTSQVSASSSGSMMQASSSTIDGPDDETRGKPHDQHPGRAPEHAAVHQRH